MMRDDLLAFVQEHVADSDGFIKQAAGIAAHIKNQAIERRRIEFVHASRKFRDPWFR